MAVGRNLFPRLPPIRGCRLSASSAGIRYQGRDDLLVIELTEGSVSAGCFTTNAFQAAPVVIAKEHLKKVSPRYLLVNSGNANACTGDIGLSDAVESCVDLARIGGVETNQVLPFSTGVIGERMNMKALKAALPQAVSALSDDSWEQAARAIMTTDTFPKGVSRSVDINGTKVTINGIAKGSGMIRPDMATMLAYIVTDAAVSQDVLQQICSLSVSQSFNRITVDGDTSTNDACMLVSTGAAGNELIESLDDIHIEDFLQATAEVFVELAKLLVRDGEGATKLVTVSVAGGVSEKDCLEVAYIVAHSPLVKTALYASDPNWGRIVAAVGRAEVHGLRAENVKLWLDDILVVEEGSVASSYSEALGQSILDKDELELRIDLGMGSHKESIWTCDMSHDYVSINADYRS